MHTQTSNPFKLLLLATATMLVAADSSQAQSRGRAPGGFRNDYNPVRDLGSDIGAFSGPYRGGYSGVRPYYNTYPFYGYGGFGGFGGFAYPVYNVNNYYAPAVPVAPVAEQRSYYPPEQTIPAAPTTATIDLYVSANAEVWLNGTKTNQTGALRKFVTPPLNPNARSTYELRVRYTGQDGQPKEETRSVEVEPGRQVVLNLQPVKS